MLILLLLCHGIMRPVENGLQAHSELQQLQLSWDCYTAVSVACRVMFNKTVERLLAESVTSKHSLRLGRFQKASVSGGNPTMNCQDPLGLVATCF